MVSGEAGAMWDVIVQFVGQCDIPISTAASPDFHQVIKAAFLGGFDQALKNPKANAEHEFAKFCPSRGPTTVRRYVVHAAFAERAKLEGVLKENHFAAMTMDGGTIGSLGLFITNLVAAHIPCCFTEVVAQLDKCHTHGTLNGFLREELRRIQQKGITVSVITCDGASYQTKSLDYTKTGSLHSLHQHDHLLGRVLFMPCLCHRLNNAYRRLGILSRTFQGFTAALRGMAVFCRKPARRRQLHRVCPIFIQTRWLYDFRILHFALQNEAAINRLGDPRHQIEPLFNALFELLRIWSELVTRLEASNCALSTAYPAIRAATNALTAHQENEPNEEVAEIYGLGIQLINQYTIESTFDLIQLAYVLTPAGRKEAYEQMQSHLSSSPPEQPALELELVDFQDQLADHEEELIVDTRPQTEEEEEEEEEEAVEVRDDTSIDISSRESSETEPVILHLPPGRFASTCLAHRAQQGLERILDQFQLTEPETQSVRAAFDNYISSLESRVGVNPTPDGTRYCWLAAQTHSPQYAVLADIALRLEPAICSEAPSERSIGQQRRFLVSYRARTKPDLLLAKTTFEDRRNQARSTGRPPNLDAGRAAGSADS
jgi:hypothetical protein